MSHSYESLLECMRALHNRASQWADQHQTTFEKAARKLRLLAPDGTLIFEDEEDVLFLANALLYETSINGMRTISAFFEANPPEDELDRQLSVAMMKARLGLYRIESVNPPQNEIKLRALVAEANDTTLTNIALSKTASPNFVIALRVLALPNISLSAGAYFPFEPAKEKRLVQAWWSKQGIDRFALLHKLFRQGNIELHTA